MRFQGVVSRQPMSTGTRSEHEAVVLETADGPLKLRRVGGNPFNDSVLNQLVGQHISCDGRLHAGQLLISDWEVEKGSDE